MNTPLSCRRGLRTTVIWSFLALAAGGTHAQTCDVTWRKADNPRVISGEVTIPAGQTVCAEPGVVVQFNSNARLILRGNLYANGTAAEPVVFTGSGVIRVVGTLDIDYGDMAVASELNPGGTILVDNTRFRTKGVIHSGTQLVFNYASRFLSVRNSVFDSNGTFQSDDASIYTGEATIVLENLTFRNGAWMSVDRSNFFARNVRGENLKYPLLSLAQWNEQPQYLDDLTVAGSLSEGLQFQAGNYQIGPNTSIQGAEYPIKGQGGLLAGSVLPTTGNRNNWIESSIMPFGIYAPQSIPWVMSGGRISGTDIAPGTTFHLKPGAAVDNRSGIAHVTGLPNAPITFRPWTTKWDYLKLANNGDKMEYIVFDGALRGLVDPGGLGASVYYVDQSIFRNNDIAVNINGFSVFYLEGNLFANNAIGVTATSTAHRMNGITNPNLFENNGIAVRSTNGGNPDVRNNWWNSPTGPTTPQNPGGTGDRIEGNAQFQPYRTERPDRTDHPPVVRLTRRPFVATAGNYEGAFNAGQKIILTWEAFDNSTIVKHKIQTQWNTNQKETFVTVADNLPGNVRSFEFTVPTSGGNNYVRIIATDDRGQEGWDEWVIRVPSANENGALQITTPFAGQTFRGGSELQLNWQITSPFVNNQFDVYLLLDGHRKWVYVAAGNQTGAFSTIKFPFVSTDSARFAVFATSPNSRWFYSEPFSIRPDARYPDAPPAVTMTSPQSGQSFAAGSVVPISWTASDDEAIRQFNLLYSTDGGRTWTTLVENLPPTTTSYNWQTPSGTGFPDVRVRVVALDRRFQNSSDGASRSFALEATPMAVTGAVSRKMHNGVVFDIPLPVNGSPGVECRLPANGGGHSIVLAFDSDVVSGNATVASGNATVSGSPTFAANTMTIPLTGVANAQTITVGVSGVTDGGGRTLAPTSVRMTVLAGDATGNNAVTASDVAQTKANVGQPVTQSNFRSDVTANGAINSSDVAVVKTAASGGASSATER